MRSPPLFQASDEEAAVLAAQSRQEGADIVRDHLEHHLETNPGRSSDYVTWVATLHPENADVTVDQRFFIPGNPWWTVYEETKNSNIPTATAVPIVDEMHQNDVEGQPPNAKPANRNTAPPFWLVCSPVDMFAGVLVAFHAALGVFLCEFFALTLCYWPAAMFYHLAQCFAPPNIFSGFLYSVLMIFYYAFALADSMVLLSSVLVAECVAGVGWLVSLCTGGILMANYWHQYIRRLCHYIRVLFRRCNHDPPRNFVMMYGMKDNQNRGEDMLPPPLPPPSTEVQVSYRQEGRATPVHHIIDEEDVIVDDQFDKN